MLIHVYQHEGRYGVTVDRDHAGRIVESWIVASKSDATFVERHGTAFAGATLSLAKLANLVGQMFDLYEAAKRDTDLAEALTGTLPAIEAVKPPKEIVPLALTQRVRRTWQQRVRDALDALKDR